MRKSLPFLLCFALVLAACVQTRQFADRDFAPPAGDYSLVVMRPVVSVGSVTTGGLVEPRADWTDAARGHLTAALAEQQAGRGGKVTILQSREGSAADPELVADLERLHAAVGNSIALHKYMGLELPTKRRQGLDWTLGEAAVRFGEATGHDYALFLYAEDSFASTGRVALQVLGIAGCFIGFCAPSGGGSQLAYASLVDLRTGEVVWFNVLRTGSQLPGMQLGDIRTPEGAAQMVDRLLGRMKPGKDARENIQ
ncbi:MAG: hypothetical protein ACFBQW_02940 [Sphingomonadaceae bacterium]